MPVYEWAYKDAPEARHVGPMAQDFHAAFGLGVSDTTIGSL
ncbi:MAG: tail fiber domain-containing protein, partial [Gemmatimonadota bacterium]